MSGILRIGFVGTGIMGAPMVQRLLQAGYPVTIWGRSPEKTQELQSYGARVATTLADMASGCEVICLCVTDTNAVEEIVFSSSGLVNTPGACSVLVDFSSIKPDATREMAGSLRASADIEWVDAPVSGGSKGAAEGNLIIMCGGAESAIEKVTPIFKVVGSRWIRMGSVGAGQVTKLCNQAIVATNIMAIAESMLLAKASGIDAARLPEALAGGWADSLPLQVIGPSIAVGNDGSMIGALSMMLKDIDSAIEFAAKADETLRVVGSAADAYRIATDRGFAGADLSSLGIHLGIREE